MFFFFLVVVIAIVLALTLTKNNSDGDDNGSTAFTKTALVGKFMYEKGPGVSDNHQKDIKLALESWNEIINDDVEIDISFYSYSSHDDTLAFAFMNDEEDIYAGGVVYINTYNGAETSMKNIIEHEIGHVLGIGTSKKWEMASNAEVLDKTIFPNAYSFYSKWTDSPNNEGIPLGSSGYHWSESVFDTELMTPYSESKGVELPTSGLTLNALKDIGWDINLEKADVLPSP